MTSIPFEDCVAIDTNVFVHLLNPEENVESHINELLQYLQREGVALIIDDGERILGEYYQNIRAVMSCSDDAGIEIYLLRYWTLLSPKLRTSLDMGDGLMRTIKEVISEPSKSVDRIFVYVAFKKGRVLITNDERDIVCGPTRESGQSPRRNRLLRGTRSHRSDGAAILTSEEAYDKVRER